MPIPWPCTACPLTDPLLLPAPRRMGVFRLTTPEGLELVQRCTQRGFHTHPEGVEIYALSPHVEFIDDAVELVDARSQ